MSFLVPLLMEHGLTTFFSWPPGKKKIYSMRCMGVKPTILLSRNMSSLVYLYEASRLSRFKGPLQEIPR